MEAECGAEGGGALQPESAASWPPVRCLPSSRGHRNRRFGCGALEPGTEGSGTVSTRLAFRSLVFWVVEL